MALMKMRQWVTEDMRGRWPFRLFQGPASVAKVVLYAALALLIGGWSFWSMIVYGNEKAGKGVLLAAVVGLVAHAQWLRLTKDRQRELLPERILCPACEAAIVLNEDERREGMFVCQACGEDFEIVDEQEATV